VIFSEKFVVIKMICVFFRNNHKKNIKRENFSGKKENPDFWGSKDFLIINEIAFQQLHCYLIKLSGFFWGKWDWWEWFVMWLKDEEIQWIRGKIPGCLVSFQDAPHRTYFIQQNACHKYFKSFKIYVLKFKNDNWK
jgi:hypothetical protein